MTKSHLSRKNVCVPSYLNEYLSDIGIGHVVELREHNLRYKEIFSKESERMISAFGQLPVVLHHVGSTSVEGLCAKPIIDMLLIYPKTVTFKIIKQTLIDVGYFFREDLLPDRTYFVLEDSMGVRYFSITTCMSGDVRAREILTFRDNLRQNPLIMEKYAALKRKFSTEAVDRHMYMNQKSEFIRQHSIALTSWD